MQGVDLLSQTYLNDKYNKLGINIDMTTNDPLLFQPVAISGYGISTVHSTMKIIAKSVPSFAPKSSMRLDDYEQLDAAGNSYLTANYLNYYRRTMDLDYFNKDEKRENFFQKSGFAKIVVANDKGERVYNGDEHTQVLTDRIGYLPIDSSFSYLIDEDRHMRVALDQVWFFFGHIEGDPKIINDLQQITPIVNMTDSLLHITISNSLNIVYCDFNETGAPVWYNLTRQYIPQYNEFGQAVTQPALFPYNTLFTSLKPGQQIMAYFRVEENVGANYAKWAPSVTRYKFATARDLGIQENPTEFESNVEQRNYIINTSDPLISRVFLNEPETIILTLESVGKLNTQSCLERAFIVAKRWLYEFRNSCLDLSRFYNIKSDQINGYIAETLNVKVDSYQYPELVLQVNNCNGAYLPLIVDSILRSFIARVNLGTSNRDSDVSKMLSELSNILEQYRLLENQRESKRRQSAFQKDDRNKIQGLSTEASKIVDEIKSYNVRQSDIINEIMVSSNSFETIKRKLQSLKLFEKSFEDEYIENHNISKHSEEEKRKELDQLLSDAKIASRVRHPLRPESYLTLKYPDRLLETVDMNLIKKYFYKGQFGDGSDLNLVNFYKILTLTLQLLEDLFYKIDRLSFQVRNKFFEKVPPTSIYYRSKYDFEYRQLLDQAIITQYEDTTQYHLPYVEEQLHSGTPVRGQRKLFLTEVFFLSQNLTPETQDEYIVYYAGAADGSHHTVLSRMFPGLKFVLFDPNFSKIWGDYQTNPNSANIFSLGADKIKFYDQEAFGQEERPKLNLKEIDFNDSHQYYIFPCFFTTNICPDLIKLSGDKKILFISDLRVIPVREAGVNSASFNLLMQQQVYDDNYLQYNIINSLNQGGHLESAMVKFRFPYKETMGQIRVKRLAENHVTSDLKPEETFLAANQFYNGKIYIQPYAPGSTTEARLIIDKVNLKGRQSLKLYNDVHYEEFFSYINNVVRRSMKFYTPELTFDYHREFDLATKYDHALELLILNSYVVNFQKNEILSGEKEPLQLIWQHLNIIETNPTMSKINWKSTI